MSIDELTTEALKLSAAARARLARDLLASLDALPAAEVEQLWLEEAARRDAELDAWDCPPPTGRRGAGPGSGPARMTLAVAFHEAAALELSDAAAFYEQECPGLGAALLDEVEAALTSLAQFPEGAPVLRGRIRRKVLLRFPYSLMYSLHPDNVRILAVAHDKRRPFYWRGRQ